MVIAGGGLAAQRCAETLRRVGYGGRVRIVCAEPHLPYDRPPLSKEVLADDAAPTSRVAYRQPRSGTRGRRVELLRGHASGLDPTRTGAPAGTQRTAARSATSSS